MSMAYPGLTHCSECGESLNGGIGICESCRQTKYGGKNKYKVGDIVKLRDDLEIGKWYDGVSYSEKIKYYQNKPVTIKQSVANTNIYVIENGTLISDEMIEGLWEESCQQVKKDDEQAITNDKDTVQQVTSKLKFIDVLNKIFNGELKEGTKVKLSCIGGYIRLIFDGNLLKFEKSNDTFNFNCEEINAECELMEPQEKVDNSTLKIYDKEYTTKINKLNQNEFAQCDELGKCYRLFDKVSELINKINVQTTVLFLQEKDIENIKEQLNGLNKCELIEPQEPTECDHEWVKETVKNLSGVEIIYRRCVKCNKYEKGETETY